MNIKALRNLLKEKKISQNEISRKIGMTQAGFSNALLKEDFKISTLEKIAKTLHVPVGYFFDEESNLTTHVNNGVQANGTNNKINIQTEKKNEEIKHLKEKLTDAQKLIEEKERHLEELRQRILDKEELIEMYKN